MRCPFCGHLLDRVVDSRESREGDSTRRRRECLDCHRRFTTYERVEDVPLMVVKKDGAREVYSRTKVLAGLLKACEKRPVPVAELERAADRVTLQLQERAEREISSREVGELVMARLRELDKVAYVRFASVYREFQDVSEFVDQIRQISDPE